MKSAITNTTPKIDDDHLTRAGQYFRPHIEVVINANQEFIK